MVSGRAEGWVGLAYGSKGVPIRGALAAAAPPLPHALPLLLGALPALLLATARLLPLGGSCPTTSKPRRARLRTTDSAPICGTRQEGAGDEPSVPAFPVP